MIPPGFQAEERHEVPRKEQISLLKHVAMPGKYQGC